ncbi:cyanate transporter [Arthrobacter crystallopoietes BAB-32]|uniref:Cyanate transporter n=1 Tax=Arthrobacter crystallopoietes BAB-32 TaxID=1246476 RepID=N1V1H5_9MICC|nr:MFS transporter [Arthrobacter crystallopoietes]EMY33834.1 cyanate transporter [Arthrobacter crystallopoietes BAB-32]
MTVAEQAKTMRTARLGFVFLGIVLIAVNLRVAFVSVGPVLSDLSAEFGWSGSTAGLLTGLPLICFALFSPVAPGFARRLGLDRALWISLLLLALGIVARSVVPAEPAVWSGTVLIGTGIAFLNVLLPSLVKRDLPSRVSQVTGIYTAIQGAVSAAGAAAVVPIAQASPYGWRLALGVWAGLALIALGILLPHLWTRSAAAAGGGDQAASYRSPWKSMLGWQVTLFMGLQSLAFFVMISWLPAIEHDQGIPAVTSGLHTSLWLLIGVAASLAAGAILHHTSDQRAVSLASSILAFCAYAGLAVAPQFALLWVVLGAAGCGSLIVIGLSLFSLRTEHHEQAASLSGMAQSIGYAIAAAGPVAFGALHDATGGWTAPLIAGAGLMLVLCVMAVLAGRNRLIG